MLHRIGVEIMAEVYLAGREKQPQSCLGDGASNSETFTTAIINAADAKGGIEPMASLEQRALPPVERWNPPFCGDIDMRIARDGTWHYCGSPISRPALVRLFSTVLRKDAQGYVLVTPAEKLGIKVEDAPFIAVEMRVARQGEGQVLSFRTNVGDWVEIGASHPMRFEKAPSDGLKPYIHVRGDLWALATRALSFDLVKLGEVREQKGARNFGVVSGATFFPIASAQEVDEFSGN
ncbi:MAG: DUF1285 domain-containing protein [Beijerinckiaceae bacterium]|nr:DUF1285 domain-containing protein [Beijerinckiaceae bacterium]